MGIEINCNNCERRKCPAIKDVKNFVSLKCPGRIAPHKTFRAYEMMDESMAKAMFKLRKQLS